MFEEDFRLANNNEMTEMEIEQIEDVEKTFDVFSKDGYYLYKTVFPFAPFVIKDGFFYTRVVNEDTGEVFVKRFRIKNWEQIKEGI